MVKSNCRLRIGIVLLCLWASAPPVHGQGHAAKVSTDVTVYFGIETELPDPNHPVAVDLSHADFEVSFRPTGWNVLISFDAPGAGGRDVPLEDALLYGNVNSRWLLSSIPTDFAFIGARPDEPFWILPQSAGNGALALGIAAEQADTDRLCRWNPRDARGADNPDRWFEVQLLAVHGPADANFALWQADGIHPPVVFMSTHDGGITADDTLYLSAGSHIHANWGFTRPGGYALDFRVATVLYVEDWLSADWAPPGDDSYYGDGQVDFQDFAWMAAHWFQAPAANDPETFRFMDPNDPFNRIGPEEMTALAEQWLLCGYPGCEGVFGQGLHQ